MSVSPIRRDVHDAPVGIEGARNNRKSIVEKMTKLALLTLVEGLAFGTVYKIDRAFYAPYDHSSSKIFQLYTVALSVSLFFLLHKYLHAIERVLEIS